MSFLTKRDVQKVDDTQIEVVEVPEWGGKVHVKGLGGTERDAYVKSNLTGKGKNTTSDISNMTAKLVARCMIDEKGERMFNNNEVAELGQKNAAALTRIYRVAVRLSGLDDDDLDKITKNSDGNQSEDSGTD